MPSLATFRAVRSSVLGLAVLGGTEKRNAPPAITRSTVKTAIPFRTTISGTVFAGARREDADDVAARVILLEPTVVDEPARSAELDGVAAVEEVGTGEGAPWANVGPSATEPNMSEAPIINDMGAERTPRR